MSAFKPTSVTKLLLLCEGQLGTVLAPGWQKREVGAMKKLMARNPTLNTLDNLVLAIEYCRRKHIEIESPRQLVGYVVSALEVAQDMTPQTDVEADRQAAIDTEVASDREDSDYWIGRLTRASGPGLLVALSAWRANRES